MTVAFIGIGSNLGKRRQNIGKAIRLLQVTRGVRVEKISSLIETKPQDAVGPDYLNGVIKIKTYLSPKELLKNLQNIETALGRRRTFKNSPRSIDLDILLYGEEVIDEPDLKIPHPRMFEREFVLKPLSEVKDGYRQQFRKAQKDYK